MTGPAGFDRTLSDWLDEAGAQDIPPRVIDAAIVEARQTRRARPLPDTITRLLPMTTNFAASPPLPLIGPRSVSRLGSMGVLVALMLLGLALIGAALLAVGVSPSPAAVHNGLIAFDSNGDIWLADPDKDYEVTRLTTTAAQETNPVWSPDGTRIAYWSNDNGTSSIGIMDADGKVITQATPSGGLDLPEGGAPAWSPDGRTIAVVGKPDFSATLLINADTGDAHQFPIFVRLPAWSPDSRLFAFVKDPNGVSTIAVDGTGLQQVLAADRPVGVNGFTPDGRRLLLGERSPTGIDADIVSIGADGRDLATIVGGPTNDWAATLSPDGQLVAFVRTSAPTMSDCCGSHTADVYVVGIDGTGLRQIGTGVGDWGTLTWSPDGSRVIAGNLASDQLIVLALDPDVSPVEIASPNNVGVTTWQAVR